MNSVFSIHSRIKFVRCHMTLTGVINHACGDNSLIPTG